MHHQNGHAAYGHHQPKNNGEKIGVKKLLVRTKPERPADAQQDGSNAYDQRSVLGAIDLRLNSLGQAHWPCFPPSLAPHSALGWLCVAPDAGEATSFCRSAGGTS